MLRRITTIALVLCVAAVPAFAAGPLAIFDPATQTPYAYPGPLSMYTDNDPMFSLTGPVTNAEADVRCAFGMAEWSAVATSTFSGSVVGDFASIGLPDINLGNIGLVIGAFNGGGYHVIYDHDGSIIAALAGPGVLGFSGPEFATTGTPDLLESYAVMNGASVDPGDAGGIWWQGVFTHEFGHGINLAHTQTNGAVGFFGDSRGPDGCPPIAGSLFVQDLETMYPFLDPRIGGTGIEQGTIEHPDDVQSISDVYPAAGYPGNTARVEGTIRLPAGTDITGVNVVIRNLADPFADCNSMLSGAFTQGDNGPDGRYHFNGLTPGADYVLYVERIIAGGFSTPPASLPGPEEYYNGANESYDANVDDVCDFTILNPVVGAPIAADVIFNIDLNLGDDDFVEVPLPFTFEFCGVDHNSVFINSNGNVTFGAGDASFSESVSGLLNGPPRIAMLWDDLNPTQGGTITAENLAGNFVITFEDIPEFFADGANTFALTLRPNGTFQIEYGDVSATDGLAGKSQGNGVPDPGETDLTTAPQPLGTGEDTVYEIFTGDNDLANTMQEYDVCTPFVFVATPANPEACYASGGAGGPVSGYLLTINPATGAATPIGPTGRARVPGLAINSSRIIYGSDGGTASDLILIDAATGGSGFVGPIRTAGGQNLNFVDALAYNGADVLYGIDDSNTLFTIDPATGTATAVGFTGVTPAPYLVGLTVDKNNGQMYASTGGLGGADAIYEIDPATGAATLVGTTGLGGSIPDIKIDGDGNMWGVKNAGGGNWVFISIDRATGAGTVVGSTGYPSMSGLAWSGKLLQANLDIKPGSCPNPFNVKLFEAIEEGQNAKKGGVLPVAILGSDEFDVSEVNVSTVRLEGVAPLGNGSTIEDISTAIDLNDCECTDDGSDGFDDLSLKFRAQEVAAAIALGLPGEDRELRLTGELLDGTLFEARDCIHFVGGQPITAGAGLPPGPALNAAFPNPFNPVTTISYYVPSNSRVTLSVYNVRGELVTTLVDRVVEAGEHAVVWEARAAASGMYFYRMQAGDYTETRKMVLLK